MISESPRIARSTVVAVVSATTLAQVASVMGVAVFPVLAPRLAQVMAIPPAAIGYQMSLIYGAAVVSAPFLGLAVARWGGCRMTQSGLVLCAIAMALALTTSLAALVVASILLGLALTSMLPAAAHLLFRFSPPKHRNLIFSIKQTGVPLAWVIMALVAPGITLAFGWQWVLAAVLAIALTIIVALQRVRSRWDDDCDPHAKMASRPFEGLAVLWRHRSVRWLAMASLCLSFVQLCLSTFAVTMLVEEMGYTLVAAGALLSVAQAAGVAGRIVWGWVADRLSDSVGVLQKLTIITTACCVLTAFLTPAWSTTAVAVFFVVFGATSVGWNGLFLAAIAQRAPRGMVSVVTGGASVWSFGGVLLGPALFSTVYNVTASFTFTFGLLTIVSIAAVVLLMFAGAAARTEERLASVPLPSR